MERIVNADEVTYLTRQGWRILETYEIDVPSWAYVHERQGISVTGHPPRVPLDAYGRPDAYYNQHGAPPKPDETPYFTIRVRKFRMHFDKKSWEADLGKREQELEERQHRLDKGVREATEAAQSAERERDKALQTAQKVADERENAVERALDLEEENDSLREKLRLMEGDLAKLR